MTRNLATTVPATPSRETLYLQLQEISTHCSRCQRCVAECQFLQKHGDPKEIATVCTPHDKGSLNLAFECSLCGLCAAVCPDHVDPVPLFLEMRRESVAQGCGEFPEHKGLISYEKKGTSKRFSWYALPQGCDTIFFPGCSLPGSRPEQTRKTFELLQTQIQNLGIVLDCCTKPSHDLGREDYFQAMFGELKQFLLSSGVNTVLVACPNCNLIFSRYAPELVTKTVYEILDDLAEPTREKISAEATVHDPCIARFSDRSQNAVRSLAAKAGIELIDNIYSREKTLCCGEGGSVEAISPALARQWAKKRASKTGGQRTLTYCSGCANKLSQWGPTNHILDLYFDPQATVADQAKVSRAPLTYWNRLRLKKHLQRNVAAAITRERTFDPAGKGSSLLGGKLLMMLLFIAAIVAVRFTGILNLLHQEQLRSLIESYGMLAPLIYMAIFAIAPVLFLPGLPISIAGAILFGPFWGVVYTITSATFGACLAFLVSRYLARDWIESKLHTPRWRQLDEQVEKQGWKMVALTRLIPLFPYNLLNYAFGLTGIKFSHYAIASFIFMLPGTIAFITFSSSLLDVLRGKLPPTFIIGLVLMMLIALLPFFYKNGKALKKQPVKIRR